MSAGTIRFAVARTAVGEVLLAARSAGGAGPRLVFSRLGGAEQAASLRAFASAAFPGAPIAADEEELEPFTRVLVAWGAGRLRDLDLPLELVGTDFERRVWQELRRIPYGETRTYGEVAHAVGEPGAARAVGRANGRNPLPVVVPCHRVVARDGIGGFTGGLHHKRRLLEHERAHAQPVAGATAWLPFPR